MRVLDLVQSRQGIFSVRDDATVHETARYLREHHVRSVGVLDGEARPGRSRIPERHFRQSCGGK